MFLGIESDSFKYMIEEVKAISVSEYLVVLNKGLKSLGAKILGEVSEVSPGPTGHIYFTLKDEKDGSILKCVIWNRIYNVLGVTLKEGDKIIAGGCPNVHNKYGLSFVSETIEYVGEGLLKKEYERLKKKFEEEGAFELARKRPIKPYVRRVGVITSLRAGIVIADFSKNLGKFGLNVKMIDSRVEGQEAVIDLLTSIKFAAMQDIEVLVIMRGGGSLESMQPFNNEIIVREILKFPVPVIAAIGHDRDVPLLSMVADKEVSTPSMAAVALSESWNKAGFYLEKFTKDIIVQFASTLERNKNLIDNTRNIINVGLKSVIQSINQKLESFEKIIYASNPTRQMEVGYSILRNNGKVVKSIKGINLGDSLDISVIDGVIQSEIKTIKPN